MISDLNDACLDEFGVEATLFPGDAAAGTITVIYDEKWHEVDPETGIGVSSTAPRIRARAADLVDVKDGDRITVAGRRWIIADLQPDGHGMMVGILTR